MTADLTIPAETIASTGLPDRSGRVHVERKDHGVGRPVNQSGDPELVGAQAALLEQMNRTNGVTRTHEPPATTVSRAISVEGYEELRAALWSRHLDRAPWSTVLGDTPMAAWLKDNHAETTGLPHPRWQPGDTLDSYSVFIGERADRPQIFFIIELQKFANGSGAPMAKVQIRAFGEGKATEPVDEFLAALVAPFASHVAGESASLEGDHQRPTVGRVRIVDQPNTLREATAGYVSRALERAARRFTWPR